MAFYALIGIILLAVVVGGIGSALRNQKATGTWTETPASQAAKKAREE